MADIAPVAGNGLLDRRAFLRRGGILITGYAVSPANAEPLSEAAWSKKPGEAFAKIVADDIARWSAVAKAANIKAE